MKAWHFVSDTLRDGRPVPADGEVLVHEGPLKLCASGLHASKNILDALQYAPGSIICRVEVGGEIIHGNDKLVCSERTILWRASGEQVLRKFARMCALDVMHLWDAPDIVVQYLKTGDESIRAAALDAVWDAARAAARDAAWAEAAARDAARDAAWTEAAARDAARAEAAARAAARDAARAAADARDAARDAAWAEAAARDAARDAAWAEAAARDAARAAADARDATYTKQSRRLERMARAAA
jgi:pyruvate/2-oxoglutarate dehydrogenase complex dihydrolipoamide acyltransferase (E2) component